MTVKSQRARTNSKNVLRVEFSSYLISFSGDILPFPNYALGKRAKFICCKVLSLFSCFLFSPFDLYFCNGKERNNYKQQTINLWGKMDSVAYLGSVSMSINCRMTSGCCCWIDDCNWWTPIDAFIHDKACVWPAVLKYLPHLNSFTQPTVCLAHEKTTAVILGESLDLCVCFLLNWKL